MCLVAILTCVVASVPHVPIASINLGSLGAADLSDAAIKHLIHHQDQTLNAITGDESWYAKFGDSADPYNATAVERIQVHLNYVRNLLEEKGTEHLSPSAAENRALMLRILRNYTDTGEFPTNLGESPDVRTPIFIDQHGVSCAVAYLILNSEEQEFKDGMLWLNQKFPLAYLTDVAGGRYGKRAQNMLLKWEKVYGFETEELAMIQPTYDFMRPPYFRPRPDEDSLGPPIWRPYPGPTPMPTYDPFAPKPPNPPKKICYTFTDPKSKKGRRYGGGWKLTSCGSATMKNCKRTRQKMPYSRMKDMKYLCEYKQPTRRLRMPDFYEDFYDENVVQ